MASSYTISETATFTLTHAKHMAAKVAADLKRLQRFYGYPSDQDIANYETEVIELLNNGASCKTPPRDLLRHTAFAL